MNLRCWVGRIENKVGDTISDKWFWNKVCLGTSYCRRSWNRSRGCGLFDTSEWEGFKKGWSNMIYKLALKDYCTKVNSDEKDFNERFYRYDIVDLEDNHYATVWFGQMVNSKNIFSFGSIRRTV